jgi:flagellar biosynthesis/type III secretory pathway M-ring protein FliF/YscJ
MKIEFTDEVRKLKTVYTLIFAALISTVELLRLYRKNKTYTMLYFQN